MESEASHQQPKRRKTVNHLSTSMQDSIPFLPAELVSEILTKLPVKSLLRFGCASKSWLALISRPEFIKTHLSLNANNKEYTRHKVMMSPITKYSFKDCILSSLYNCTEAKELDYSMKSFGSDRRVPYGFSIVGSANGLICLVTEYMELFLWNPSIRKCKKLPDPITSRRYSPWRVYGFGYDEFHDDYKVVVIFSNIVTDRSRAREVKTYSMKSDSWRRINDCRQRPQANVSGKFLNGKLHWAATTGRLHLATTTTGPELLLIRNIISVDLTDEKWGEMEQPCNQKGANWLGVLGSDLSVFCNCSHTHVDVWVMKEYGAKESWTKIFTIKYPEDGVRYGSLGQICLHMANDSEILVSFGSTFMIYHPKGDSLRYSKSINSDKWDKPEIYVESLVCPLSIGGTEDAAKEGLKMPR